MPKEYKTIAIETSGHIGSVALGINGQLLAEKNFSRDMAHARELLPVMADLCRQAGWQPPEITHLYLTIGPGSFTGLRIAVSCAKALAFALPISIVPVPTTEALALNALDAERQAGVKIDKIALVLDAKRNQIYTAVFERRAPEPWDHDPLRGFAEDLRCILPPCLRRPQELLEEFSGPLAVLGEGLAQHGEAFADRYGVTILDAAFWSCQARHVLSCGRRRFQADLTADAATLQPLYLRRPEAVERWEQLHHITDQNF